MTATTRRERRSRYGTSLLAFALAAGLAAPAAAQDAAKPNILFIMGEDIGYMQPSI